MSKVFPITCGLDGTLRGRGTWEVSCMAKLRSSGLLPGVGYPLRNCHGMSQPFARMILDLFYLIG